MRSGSALFSLSQKRGGKALQARPWSEAHSSGTLQLQTGLARWRRLCPGGLGGVPPRARGPTSLVGTEEDCAVRSLLRFLGRDAPVAPGGQGRLGAKWPRGPPHPRAQPQAPPRNRRVPAHWKISLPAFWLKTELRGTETLRKGRWVWNKFILIPTPRPTGSQADTCAGATGQGETKRWLRGRGLRGRGPRGRGPRILAWLLGSSFSLPPPAHLRDSHGSSDFTRAPGLIPQAAAWLCQWVSHAQLAPSLARSPLKLTCLPR